MLGIFDSGLGGLTALKEARVLFPGEDIVYFGDTGRVPYGTRSPETIRKYAVQDLKFLTSFPIRAAVVACGTVSTTSLPLLRSSFSLPIFGVVEGAAEAAAKATKSGTVAVIGTPATVRSGAFERAVREHGKDLNVISLACPLFVPLVENGFVAEDDPITLLTCERYLAPIRESGADTLILGCTHYPILARSIAKVLPGVTLINTGREAARLVRDRLPAGAGENETGKTLFFVSDRTESFTEVASCFLGSVPEHVEQIDIERYQ